MSHQVHLHSHNHCRINLSTDRISRSHKCVHSDWRSLPAHSSDARILATCTRARAIRNATVLDHAAEYSTYLGSHASSPTIHNEGKHFTNIVLNGRIPRAQYCIRLHQRQALIADDDGLGDTPVLVHASDRVGEDDAEAKVVLRDLDCLVHAAENA